MRILPILLLLAFAVGCTPSTTLALSDQPQGTASRTGTVPLLTPNPTGQTVQLTEEEKAALRADLTAAAAPGQAAAAQASEGQLQTDVAALRAEAESEQARRLLEIEDREIKVATPTIGVD